MPRGDDPLLLPPTRCYSRTMSSRANNTAEILEDAMHLPESERRTLALRLLDTVGDEPLEEIERRWVDEARRRSDAVGEGRSQRVPWDEARARIFSRS